MWHRLEPLLARLIGLLSIELPRYDDGDDSEMVEDNFITLALEH